MMRIIPELSAREEPCCGIARVGGDRGAVKTEILEQHRRMGSLLEKVREDLRAGDAGASVRRSFSELREALETHFEQEDRLYFPSIWALRPSQKARLQSCVATHDALRSMLGEIADLLERNEPTRATHTFDLLAEGFESHEALEEEILAELDREVADTGRAEQVERSPSGA
jgi:iron-sulfur cluster repair protein YtfE (RIC family)